MPILPPVADPTASIPPHSTGVLATPTSTATTALISNSVAPAPPRAPVLATGGVRTVAGLGAQASTTTSSVKASSKSKKKAQAGSATVTMATAATAQSAGGQAGSSGENTGRWTTEEHNLFLQGLELHGKGWKKIAGLIKSRTVVQIRTHAQKYFQKLAKAKQNGEDVTMTGGGASNGGVVTGSNMTMMMGEGGRSALSGGAVANAAGSALSSSSGAGAGHAAAHSNKRRKQTSGTKRKAIQSVVASARREGEKKLTATSTARTTLRRYEQTTTGTAPNPIMDYVAPALAPYVLPTPLSSMGVQQTETDGGSVTAPGVICVSALEDSLYVFLHFVQ
jgi:SHAQKYF class myb-like DNA-binding protein